MGWVLWWMGVGAGRGCVRADGESFAPGGGAAKGAADGRRDADGEEPVPRRGLNVKDCEAREERAGGVGASSEIARETSGAARTREVGRAAGSHVHERMRPKEHGSRPGVFCLYAARIASYSSCLTWPALTAATLT